MTTNIVTEQLTAAGRAIEHDSFSIIDAEWPAVHRHLRFLLDSHA